ncbi:hypothetical protein NK8_65950 (plasmid) [Caballeronia sp. NK8]|nr:hypothetical protein NK8_65950 [Caballeronia sp. NK8]
MARRMAEEAGVPNTPGSRGTVASPAQAREIAREIGYPVLLKAAAGGGGRGGRGMRVVHDPADLDTQFGDASREAKAAFGDGSIYVENF